MSTKEEIKKTLNEEMIKVLSKPFVLIGLEGCQAQRALAIKFLQSTQRTEELLLERLNELEDMEESEGGKEK